MIEKKLIPDERIRVIEAFQSEAARIQNIVESFNKQFPRQNLDYLTRISENIKNSLPNLAATQTISSMAISSGCMDSIRAFQDMSNLFKPISISIDRALEPIKLAIKNLGMSTIVQGTLLSSMLDLPTVPKPILLEQSEKDRLDMLLENLDPALKKKRDGAWKTFNSDNPDRLSQSANSMVELLRHTIKKVCGNIGLKEFLIRKYQSKRLSKFAETQSKWIDETVNYILETKDRLEGIKHHEDFRYENIVEVLMSSTEGILIILLDGLY